MNKPNPDNRKDNVERIQYNIDQTKKNYELAKDMIAKTSDEKLKRDLQAKNQRRLKAMEGMIEEIKEEAAARETGYKR